MSAMVYLIGCCVMQILYNLGGIPRSVLCIYLLTLTFSYFREVWKKE